MIRYNKIKIHKDIITIKAPVNNDINFQENPFNQFYKFKIQKKITSS